MKQTAVEWLITELEKYEKGISEYFSIPAIHNAAYRIEKEQIGRAYQEGLLDGLNHTPKDYYNETFNTNDK
jgi:hypothetical protein